MISERSCATTWRRSLWRPEREQKIVEEWAAQLEEIYDALRADGLSDDEAWSEIERQVPDWNALSDELLDAEPVVVRLADAAAARSRRLRRAVARWCDTCARC